MLSKTTPQWVDEEMKTLALPDERLEKRTRKIISDFSQNPTASIPQFCGDGAATKGVYSYCQNKAVERAAIVEAQRQATVERIRTGDYQRVLAVQDTTEYNYQHHPATQELGPLDNAQVQGFFAHSSLAVSAEGLPLGLQVTARWYADEGLLAWCMDLEEALTDFNL